MDTKSRILQAASKLFLEQGVTGLSVRAIAKTAGLSTIGIYSHFQGKQGILDALYIEGYRIVEKAMQIDPSGLSAFEIVDAATRGYLDVADAYEAHYRLIFGEVDSDYTPSAQARTAAKNAFKALLNISAATLPPGTPPDDIRRSALEVWAIVHGFVSLKHHAVSEMVPDLDWRQAAINAVRRHVGQL